MGHYRRKNHPDHSIIAGFISGIAFYVYPKYQIYTLAFTKAVEMSWTYTMEKIKPDNVFLGYMQRVNKLPILWFMRIISLGVMYHTALFYPHLSPEFNTKAFNFCSNDA